LHEKFNAPPRDLIFYARTPGNYETFVRKEIDRLYPGRLYRAFLDPESYSSSYLIITVAPSSESRSTDVKTVASPYVLDLLWERYARGQIDVIGHLYDIFQANPIGAPAAGRLFELRMHQVLMQAQAIQVFPIRGRRAKGNLIYTNCAASEERQNPMNLQLAESAEHSLVEAGVLETNCYYRLGSKTFPTIDSLLLIHPPNEPSPILLMLRITLSRTEHDVNEKGLGKVNDLQLPSGTRRYYVVVTPEDIHPKITVPMKYFQDEEQQVTSGHEDGDEDMLADSLFPVFHYPVRMKELFAP
jgi:hypothetical protein